MKQIHLTIFTILFLSFSVHSQVFNTSENGELTKIKKEITSIKSDYFNTDKTNYSVNNYKTETADIGNPPEWEWIKTYGGSGKDIIRETTSTDNGIVYITGSFSGIMNIESINYISQGSRDGFVAKISASGSLIWFKQFSPSIDNKLDIYSICVDDSENIYCTGYYTGNVSFGTINLDADHDKNLFVLSLNSEGEVLMAANHETIYQNELGFKIATDINDNIIVLGSTDGTTSIDHSSVVIKYSPNGTMLQDFFHSQTFTDMGVYADKIYFIGTFNTPDYLGEFYLHPPMRDLFVAKSDANFVFEWAKMPTHTINYAYSRGLDLSLSPGGEIFISGIFQYDISFDNLELSGHNYSFFAKFNSSGELSWLNYAHDYSHLEPSTFTVTDDNLIAFFNYELNSYELNELRKYETSTGELFMISLTEEEIESINYCAANNSLIISQNIGEYIGLSYFSESLLSETWSGVFEGNSAQTISIGMDIDNKGNFYNYGYTSNKINIQDNDLEKGLFLIKHDANGNPIWVKNFKNIETTYYTPGSSIVVDTNSNSIYISGNFNKTFKIPDGPTLNPNGIWATFIIKYDLNGSLKWATKIDGKINYISLANDYSGNIILGGVFSSTLSIGNETINSIEGEDAIIIKFNETGDYQWSQVAGGESIEYFAFVSTDAADNVYLTGEFDSENVIIDNLQLHLEEGDGNIFFAKFNPQGEVQWAKVKGGCQLDWGYGDYYGWPTGIETDMEGNSYIKGWHADSTTFDNILLTSQFEKPGTILKYNKFIAKFDTDGNTIWAKSMSELSYSFDYNQFDIDQDGNVYSGYWIKDTTIIDGNFTYINSGLYDIIILKYTTNGELKWVKSIKGSETGLLKMRSVKAVNPESCYVNGWFNNQANFGSSTFNATNINSFIGLLGEPIGIINNEVSKSELFKVFPNPANNIVNIVSLENSNFNTEINITDVSGKYINTLFYNKNQKEMLIDVSGFSSGIYFLTIKSGAKTDVKKLIIE